MSAENSEAFEPEIVSLTEPEHEKSLWEKILDEAEDGRQTFLQLKEQQHGTLDPKPKDEDVSETAMEYLDRLVMPVLLPALEDTLAHAILGNCLELQRGIFNGVDHIVEFIWNKNREYPERALKWTTVYNIPMVKQILQEKPRPFYPKSWIWTDEQASIVIQAAVRSYLIRCNEDVQEMRQFWKILRKIAEDERHRLEEEEDRQIEEEWRKKKIIHEEHVEVVTTIQEKILEDVMEIIDAHHEVKAARWAMNKEYVEPYMAEVYNTIYEMDSYSDDDD